MNGVGDQVRGEIEDIQIRTGHVAAILRYFADFAITGRPKLEDFDTDPQFALRRGRPPQ